MCGEDPDSKMGWLCLWFEDLGGLTDDQGDYVAISANELAKLLDTTPQIAVKLIGLYPEIWKRSVRSGHIVYAPVSDK